MAGAFGELCGECILMEFEFDKEIDAILRKSVRTDRVASSQHLDADIISAFAENALPERSRSAYTMHLADCDKCRKVLSQVISLNDGIAEKAAAAPIAAAAQEHVPWYAAFFRTPNLAVAMGGLILVFSWVLGYLVIQNGRGTEDAVITQISEPEARPSGPFAGEELPAANTNANAAAPSEAITAPAANAVADTQDPTAARSAQPSGSGSDGELRAAATGPVEDDAPAKETASQPKPGTVRQPLMSVAPPPPPPASEPVGQVATMSEEAKKDAEIERAERSDASLAAKKRSVPDDRSRDLPPASARVGPTRSGPVQMQSNQVHNNAGDMSVTRTVGGKKFTNRDGAWYDTSYRGQATINVRRGTEEFRKLDSGLRSIAGRIDGVIVVVWRSRAYRIQ